jgi:SpoVK/Ycf46/Vps4 family AAA+-type ATPase
MSKWIEELSIERSTQYSNGIIVQTDDCKRISEFFIVMKKQHPKPIVMRIKNKQTGIWIRENYYILDGWEGLCQFKKNNGSWSLVNIADAKKYGGEFRPLLTAVGKELEKGNAVVVIQNMLTSDKFINNALRSWSTSDILRNKNSTVIVFTEDMNMFPENVWSKMKIIDVPKSETEERREIISSQQMAMGLPQSVLLKDEELKSAVRVTAGMNLDQVDASVVESLIRHNRIKIGSLANSKNEMLGKNPGLDIIQRPDFGFEAIGGYDTLKERIRSDVILPLQHPDVAKKYDMSPPRGMILFGPPGCFVEGTFVTMADGSLKRIEYFGKYHLQEINEKIKTTSEMGKDDAVQFHIYDNCPCYEIITESGRKVECSYNQQFWTIDEEWKQADQLNVGEKIRTISGYEKIKSVKKTGNRTVYDITTKTQEFIANGIKVHNTGKTVMTKAMSRELNMSVLVLRPENFMSKYVGESEKGLKNVFKIADSMAPCILFLDEVDRLSKRASAGGSDGGAQVHREIFSMMLEKLGDERRKWFFVGCTNRLEDIDEAMRRTGRIDTLAPVPYPDEKAKERIFQIHSTVKRKLPLAEKINFKELASNRYTYMWSGSDIEELVRRTAKEVMKQSITDGKVRNIKMDDFYKMIDTFNVDSTANETLQENIKEQAKKLTNDKRLMDVFDEAQVVDEGGRGEKAKEVMTSRALENYIDFDEDED